MRHDASLSNSEHWQGLKNGEVAADPSACPITPLVLPVMEETFAGGLESQETFALPPLSVTAGAEYLYVDETTWTRRVHPAGLFDVNLSKLNNFTTTLCPGMSCVLQERPECSAYPHQLMVSIGKLYGTVLVVRAPSSATAVRVAWDVLHEKSEQDWLDSKDQEDAELRDAEIQLEKDRLKFVSCGEKRTHYRSLWIEQHCLFLEVFPGKVEVFPGVVEVFPGLVTKVEDVPAAKKQRLTDIIAEIQVQQQTIVQELDLFKHLETEIPRWEQNIATKRQWQKEDEEKYQEKRSKFLADVMRMDATADSAGKQLMLLSNIDDAAFLPDPSCARISVLMGKLDYAVSLERLMQFHKTAKSESNYCMAQTEFISEYNNARQSITSALNSLWQKAIDAGVITR